jgi:SIR2-like domain
MFDLPLDHYEHSRPNLVALLAGALKEGSLAFLLGAGCSTGMSLPGWHQIVNALSSRAAVVDADKAHLLLGRSFTSRTPADQLFARMETVRNVFGDADYLIEVRRELYRNHPKGISKEPTALLRAIGAAMISSKRGSVRDVITLNFDCIIEWYLGFHGIVAQVISRWPRLLFESDVRIYHPHGYLPISEEFGEKSEMIVFDAQEVDSNLRGETPWQQVFKQLLTSRVILAVGLSGRDYLLRSLIYDAAESVHEAENRPLGCWLCTPSVREDTRAQLRKRGFVVYGLNSEDETADLIYDICRTARDDVVKW